MQLPSSFCLTSTKPQILANVFSSAAQTCPPSGRDQTGFTGGHLSFFPISGGCRTLSIPQTSFYPPGVVICLAADKNAGSIKGNYSVSSHSFGFFFFSKHKNTIQKRKMFKTETFVVELNFCCMSYLLLCP